jgi:hypothetical protein
MRRYVLLDLGKTVEAEKAEADISLADAKSLVARTHGFSDWQALAKYVATLPKDEKPVATKPVTLFTFERSGSRRALRRGREWDTLFAFLHENRIGGLNANGQMTDTLLESLSRFDHITALELNGSKQVSDAGVRFLARMPRLQYLDLTGTGISDRGMEILAQLKELKTIRLSWTQITDTGAAHLESCDGLERLDLTATHTGDGTLKTLVGKRHLRHLMTGVKVTDTGLKWLHQFPVFKTWQGGEHKMALLDYEAGPNYLGLRGKFTDRGIADLAGLDGLFALNVDDSKLAITTACLASIVNLPNLGWLAFDAKDDAMPYIAAMPKLRFLMCQDTTAGDDGFVALSASKSIEYIWGRRCYNLRARGFRALAQMARLRALAVSCKNVDERGLSALPEFPVLRELMPMDVPDQHYTQIGRCQGLESLVLMYCRDTSDVATEQIVHLPKLKNYVASYARITDRSMELLSQISSLEDICFYGCPAVTDAGVKALARLPHLRRLDASGPQITSACAAAFPMSVQTRFGRSEEE